MKKRIPMYMINSFTTDLFKGNPAAICLLEETLDEKTMQSIATELGVSETAFLSKIDVNSFEIRYYSPKMEIPLCGHATLAAASVLFETNDTLNEVIFHTIERFELKVRTQEGSIIMDLPKYTTTLTNAPRPLLDALGLKSVLQARYNKETNILLLEVDSAEVLKSLDPDKTELINAYNEVNGVLITSKSSEENFDFVSRYFWPWSGTLEDPVTGATHTFLAPYWGEKLNKTKLRSFQCSKRTGFMTVEIKRNGVRISGQTALFFEGHITI
ncbi:MAG: PhzF family phenazine biosynthesis isomerase [Bacteroidota bacterium]